MHQNLDFLLPRLAALRLAIATIWLLFLTYLQWQGFHKLAPAWGLLALYMPLLLVSLWQGQRSGFQDWHLLLHLAFEVQLLTGLLFFTGGATNPFISYFLVLMVVGAYALPKPYLLLLSLLCVADYTLLSQWYQPLLTRQLSPEHAMAEHALFDLHLSGMWLTFLISAFIVVVFIPQLRQRQFKQQQEIARLREQQLKNEQLIGIATLAAGTAHEMGTPLMTMHMLLSEIGDDSDGKDVRLYNDDWQLLSAQVASCRDSLQRLANAGRQAYEEGTHNAHHWLHTLLQRWRLSHPNALWHDRGIGAEALIPASPLLDQALLNLLDNAAEAGQQAVTLTASIEGGYWQLDITQPDPNASRHIQQQGLFSSQKQQGLGLGLYLSNASVEQFGGSIELFASDDGSTTSRLRLPVQQGAHYA
ncbi:ATP-binding protein [Bacterioplanes sanyensis]|nr:ATP-binding protein [Bacterioplanes sanyensis]